MGAKVIVVSEQGHSIQGLMDVPLFKNKPVLQKKSGISLRMDYITSVN